MKKSDFEMAKYLEEEMKKLNSLKESLMLRDDFDKKIIINGQHNDGSTLEFEFDLEHSYGFFLEDLTYLVEQTYIRVEKEFKKYVE